MTPDTLKYLEGMLTERILKEVEGLPAWGSSMFVTREAHVRLLKDKEALKEVRRAIRRAETRAARGAKAAVT